MKRIINRKMVIVGMSIFIAGIAANSSVIFENMNIAQTSNNIIKAIEVSQYTETVDGVEWCYRKDFDRVTNVYPVNKAALPDEVIIPDKLGGISVTGIGKDAFSGAKVKSVTIPDTVETINAFAFADCPNLVTIKVPQTTIAAYEGAFKNCKALTEISINSAFESSFEGCTNLKTVTIPERSFISFMEIRSRAFKGCSSLQEVSISDAMESLTIGSYAFEGCTQLKSFKISNNSISLGKSAFSGCTKLSDVALKGKIKGKTEAFHNCTSLTSLTIEGDVTLACGSFKGCTSLEKVTFNGDVIAIFSSSANSLFEGCPSLKKVIFNGENADVTFDQNVAVEEIIYNNTKTICGGLNGVNTLKKVVFDTQNPDLSRFTYSNGSNFSIEGYRENGTNAALPGHDTVYQWVESKNLASSFRSLGTFTGQIDYPVATLPATSSSIATEPISQAYYVNFDGNGGFVNGIIAKFQREVISGQTYGSLQTATRKGYTFKGWYTQKTGGKKITADTKVTITPNTTLYAQWNKVSVAQGKIGKLTNRKAKKFTVAIKKVSMAKGYEILYSNSKSFADINQKTVSASATSYTTSKLVKGQTYYVKVRAYKVDSTGNKIYGKYSAVKKVKIKK